jgi:ABC-2 type transport system permease protein
MSKHEIEALGAFFLLGWRRAVAERAANFGRLAMYALLLFIFWALWNATPIEELRSANLSVEQLFWYLAATEVVAMSVGFPYRTVETDIVSGSIATSLNRPLSYTLVLLADCVGETSYRFVLMAAAGFAICVWTTHSIPFGWATGVSLAVTLWVACVMVVLSQLQLGLLSAWTKSAAPAFWVWQKLFFVLGGLIIPLTLYPPALRAVAEATPFAAMLFLPASLTFDGAAERVLIVYFAQFVWLALHAVSAWAINRAAESTFLLRGV